MRCPKCGYENKPDAEVCGLCRAVKFVKSGGAAPVKPATGRPAAGAPAPAPSGGSPKLTAAAPPKASGPKHLLVRVGAPPIELNPGTPFTFGRQPECSLSIPSGRVSRVHAEITWQDTKPVLADKGSSNGTFVSGKRITSQALAPGNEISIGPFLCVYQVGDPAQFQAEPEKVESQTITEQGDLLAGQIGDTGLAEVVQGLEFNGKTGTLTIFSREGDGWMQVQGGQPHSAEAKETLKNEEAVIFLLMLKAGRFTFTSEFRDGPRTIKQTMTGLLLEWGRRADEAGQAGSVTATDAP
jgi:pSer/pThr/pTyr-binding forkhead associated (FHA) protein